MHLLEILFTTASGHIFTVIQLLQTSWDWWVYLVVSFMDKMNCCNTIDQESQRPWWRKVWAKNPLLSGEVWCVCAWWLSTNLSTPFHNTHTHTHMLTQPALTILKTMTVFFDSTRKAIEKSLNQSEHSQPWLWLNVTPMHLSKLRKATTRNSMTWEVCSEQEGQNKTIYQMINFADHSDRIIYAGCIDRLSTPTIWFGVLRQVWRLYLPTTTSATLKIKNCTWRTRNGINCDHSAILWKTPHHRKEGQEDFLIQQKDNPQWGWSLLPLPQCFIIILV